ncbi:MAG: MATE family efflux transporter, partial [Muribaculaceae bacterium]
AGNVITHLYMGLNAMLRSSGHPKEAMYATIATVVINTILDPVFIYGLNMGIRGAAVATVLAQVISLVWQLKIFSNKNEIIHFKRGIFMPRMGIVKDSFSIGLSPSLMNLAACLVVLLVNQGLVRYGGDLAVGAYGIVNRLVFVMVMIVVGFNQAMQPIAGYNYGAGLHSRVISVLKRTMVAATIVTTTSFAVFMLFANEVVQIFTTDAVLIDLSARGLRVVSLMFPIVGMQMVASNFFQSIGEAGKAIVLSMSRQMLMLVPMLLVLPQFFGIDGVWVSMPVADALASLLAALLLYKQFKHLKK